MVESDDKPLRGAKLRPLIIGNIIGDAKSASCSANCRDIFGIGCAFKYGRTGNKRARACGHHLASIIRRYAAINLDGDRTIANHRFGGSNLVDHGIDKALPPKSGIDRHHKDKIQPVKNMLQTINRRMRIHRNPSLAAKLADMAKTAVKMRAGLRMNGNDIRSGSGIFGQ